MTRYRVTATIHGKRIATTITFLKKYRAQEYADKSNRDRPGINARVVKDSERVRKMGNDPS
jgi:hypothetical protein